MQPPRVPGSLGGSCCEFASDSGFYYRKLACNDSSLNMGQVRSTQMHDQERDGNCAPPSRKTGTGVSRTKRVIRHFVRLLMVSYLAMGAYFWCIQDDRIFKPLSVQESKARRDDFQTPADLGLKYEPIEIATHTPESPIHGFWLPASDEAPIALYLHGQEVTRHNNLHHAKCLHDLGCSVLVIDYRGYGETRESTNPSEESVCEDAEASWDYLTGKGEISPERILIYGHSLGGAIAIELAARHPEAGGLVIESAFTSIKEMANLRNPLTYVLPLDLLLRHKFDSVKTVRENALPPVLFVHGKEDAKVPVCMCNELFEATRGPRKYITLLEGAGHAHRGEQGQKKYDEEVAEFLKHYFGT